MSPGSGKQKTGAGQARGSGSSSGGSGGKGGRGRRGFYILLGGLAVAGIATLSYMSVAAKSTVSLVDATSAPIPNQGHVMGSDAAPVEVVEYGDFECPGCGSFATLAEPDIRTRLVNTGLIRFRYVDFPLSIHPNTFAAHLASWCAGEQGKFWEMHDAIFMNQDRWNTQATRRPERVLEGLARQVGVNAEQYESCMGSGKYVPQIRSNVDEGSKRGVSGTPTFFIGSKRIAEPLTYDEFKKYVDEALAEVMARRAGATSPKTPATKTPVTKAPR
ncbi:MAG: DsbA family protein [Gemmatimonadaceae bacterium]